MTTTSASAAGIRSNVPAGKRACDRTSGSEPGGPTSSERKSHCSVRAAPSCGHRSSGVDSIPSSPAKRSPHAPTSSSLIGRPSCTPNMSASAASAAVASTVTASAAAPDAASSPASCRAAARRSCCASRCAPPPWKKSMLCCAHHAMPARAHSRLPISAAAAAYASSDSVSLTACCHSAGARPFSVTRSTRARRLPPRARRAAASHPPARRGPRQGCARAPDLAARFSRSSLPFYEPTSSHFPPENGRSAPTPVPAGPAGELTGRVRAVVAGRAAPARPFSARWSGWPSTIRARAAWVGDSLRTCCVDFLAWQAAGGARRAR
eukprot:scaffold54107_cov75-Phaeocystis_antarctica.AAC.3